MSVSELAEAALLRAVLRGDRPSWRELVGRYESGVREAMAEAASSIGPVTDDQLDDLVGEFWLLLLEDDLRRLRRFRVTHAGALQTWLALVGSQLARNRARRLARAPHFVRLEVATREVQPIAEEKTTSMLDVDAVARRWGVNTKTIYAMIQRGELRAVRFGRLVRIARTVVDSFEQGRAVSGGK